MIEVATKAGKEVTSKGAPELNDKVVPQSMPSNSIPASSKIVNKSYSTKSTNTTDTLPFAKGESEPLISTSVPKNTYTDISTLPSVIELKKENKSVPITSSVDPFIATTISSTFKTSNPAEYGKLKTILTVEQGEDGPYTIPTRSLSMHAGTPIQGDISGYHISALLLDVQIQVVKHQIVQILIK